MRLAQAARNLSITTDDIIAFLSKKGIEVEKDSNTKLDEESVSLLFDYFDTKPVEEKEAAKKNADIDNKGKAEVEPTTHDETNNGKDYVALKSNESNESNESVEKVLPKDQSVVTQEHSELHSEDKNSNSKDSSFEPAETQEDNKPAEENNMDVAHIHVEGKVDENDKEKIDELTSEVQPSSKRYKTVADILDSETTSSTEEDIVIKAPKISLKGLNVLGKIDLPEPKPKEEKQKHSAEKDKSSNINKKKAHRRLKDNSRGKKRELTPQQIREREKKREARKQEEAERLRKKKKEAYYKEKILKPTQEKQKKNKPKKARTSNTEVNKKQVKPQPTTLLGKFWRWLNT
ncbi:hypothetical protein GCM10011506_15490 [Marivirga lumbricoides]|uniref:Translation initiation factor IF-2 n=1 Tax=Marivirga lumbricoides TaxID=1046115 RepID=A0ABQ1LWA5_9BACT|nr:hypothetical protein GCM10011506_15490 [Marivirga lumbricoides]